MPCDWANSIFSIKYVTTVELVLVPVLVLVNVIDSVAFTFEAAVRFAESILKLAQVIPGSVHDMVTGTVGGGDVINVPASSTPTIAATTISRTPKIIDLFFINHSGQRFG